MKAKNVRIEKTIWFDEKVKKGSLKVLILLFKKTIMILIDIGIYSHTNKKYRDIFLRVRTGDALYQTKPYLIKAQEPVHSKEPE